MALGGWYRLAGPIRFRLAQRGARVEVLNEQEMRAELGKATIDAILKGLAVYGAQFDTLDDVN